MAHATLSLGEGLPASSKRPDCSRKTARQGLNVKNMNIPKLFIVADRGELKLLKLVHEGGRPPHFRLENSMVIEEAHQSYRERFTDQAGSFPNPSSQGHGGSIAEHHALDTETDRRIFSKLAARINLWLEEHHSPAWAFAAPEGINSAILKKVLPQHKAKLHRNLAEDLIHLPGDKLMDHLEAAAP